MPIAGECFYNNCHSGTQIINEIINNIEIQKRRKIAAGEILFTEVIKVCIEIMNQIVNEIEIQAREKPVSGEIFFTAFVTVCIQIMNQIMNEIEIQEREKPATGEIFHNICHSRSQIGLINEIVNE